MHHVPATEHNSFVISLTDLAIDVPLALEGGLPAANSTSNIPRHSTQVTLEGDVSNGTVYHLAHHHPSRCGSDYDSRVEGGQRNAAILRELAALGTSFCFVEGVEVKCNMAARLAEPHSIYESLIAKFPTRQIPPHINDEQALLLSHPLWPRVIHFFFPTMSIEGTEPRDRRLVNHQYFTGDPATHESILHYYREVIALDAIITLLRKQPDRLKTAALIYGRNHNFTGEDLPVDCKESDAPVVVKYNFEPWSTTDSTLQIVDATSELDQITAIKQANRIKSCAWPKALSSEVQFEMIPKLKVNIDYYDSPEEFLKKSIETLVDGPLRPQVELLLRAALQNRQGPFADLFLRPNCDKDLKRASGEFPSVVVYDELHPYTQLEMIRRASHLESYCFANIITEKGQLEALKKLIPSPGYTFISLKNSLFEACASKAVHFELLRRMAARETPFNYYNWGN